MLRQAKGSTCSAARLVAGAAASTEAEAAAAPTGLAAFAPRHATHRCHIAAALLVAALLCALFLGGCSQDDSGESDDSAEAATVDLSQLDLEYTDRDQDPSYSEDEATYVTLADGATATGANAGDVSADGQTVTISAEGVYVLSGSLSDGQVLVEAGESDKVQLVLAGVSVYNADGPAIRLNTGDKAFITLAEGSQNALSDGTEYALDENSDEPYATLYSKIDLTLNGAGTLDVQGNYCHAICSKDDLVVTGGAYTLTSVEDALRGRDCVKVLDGTFAIEAGEDAVKSNNDEDSTRGYVLIDGGEFTVTAGDDAFHAETAFLMRGGTVQVDSCYEGYEGQLVQIEGGTTNITATDDGLNAASGSSSDDAIGDGTLPDMGDFDPDNAPQGNAGNAGEAGGEGSGETPDGAGDASTGQAPELPDGATPEDGGTAPNGDDAATDGATPPDLPNGDNASSDGQAPSGNAPGDAADGNPENSDNSESGSSSSDNAATGDAAGAAMLGAGLDVDSSCQVIISGGTVYLNTTADGIDSNGSIEVTGGVVLIDGPASGGEGALDYGTDATISGGVVLMAGSSGMALSFSEGSQAFALVQAEGQAGQSVAVADSDGNVVAAFTVQKAFECVVVSAPDLQSGETYQLVVGGELSGGTEENGLTTGGTVIGGTSTEFTASTEGSQGGFSDSMPDGFDAGDGSTGVQGDSPSGAPTEAPGAIPGQDSQSGQDVQSQGSQSGIAGESTTAA